MESHTISVKEKRLGFPGGSDSKESTCNAGYLDSVPGLGRSPRERNGYLPRYCCLENSMNRWSLVGYSPWVPEQLNTTKQESSRKTSISALLTMRKPLTVWITTNWKILKETGIPDHLTCLLRNLYAGQEATVRTGHGTAD